MEYVKPAWHLPEWKEGLVSLHVVCVCCACGAAFTGAYGGFACWAKSWHSYRSHFVISNTVIADFQSRLFSSDRETFPSQQRVRSDFPPKFITAPPPHWHTGNTQRNTWTRIDRNRHVPVYPLFMPRPWGKSLTSHEPIRGHIMSHRDCRVLIKLFNVCKEYCILHSISRRLSTSSFLHKKHH